MTRLKLTLILFCNSFAPFYALFFVPLFAPFFLSKLMIGSVEGLPFPAPNLQRCRSSEDCCTPVLDTRIPMKFEFQEHLPLRVRAAAHLVDSAYEEKYQRAYELMRALPDSDGRSLRNQARLHCAYCDNSFYFEGNQYPLEIHQSWLFLPWHRMFVYFHERILAHLLGDDTFALPFWNWDDQTAGSQSGNMVPEMYATQTGFGPHGNTSFLYDSDRNARAKRPRILNMVSPFEGCSNKSDETLRRENAHLMYTQMVTGGVTPSLFFGMPYRFGDFGGVGGGTLEVKPHGPVHVWVNEAKMLTNRLSASDPIFFGHHANVDRLWMLWKSLPGGVRRDLDDSDWLDTEFTYYGEDGRLVEVSVAQSLDIDRLRYTYQNVPIPWTTGATDALDTSLPSWPPCNTNSQADMLATTPLFRPELRLSSAPITFRLTRTPTPSPLHIHTIEDEEKEVGVEVLQLKGRLDWTLPASFNVFLNFPGATVSNTSNLGCREFVGAFVATPHEGASRDVPGRFEWRVGVAAKVQDLGVRELDRVAVTLVGVQNPNQTVTITSAQIVHVRA